MNWISVKDALPKQPGNYLVYVPTFDGDVPFISIAWCEPYFSNRWQLIPICLADAVTHWCELTYPKKED